MEKVGVNSKRPTTVYYIITLLVCLCIIFIIWGWYAESILVKIPSWVNDTDEMNTSFVANLYWVFLIGTIIYFGSAGIMLLISYGLLKKHSWAWTSAMIINSLCLLVFGIMLAAFLIAALIFQDIFSIIGIVTTVLALSIDISIVYMLTRNPVKMYFKNENHNLN